MLHRVGYILRLKHGESCCTMKRLLVILILAVGLSDAFAAIIQVGDLAAASVQTAINNAAEGDTIVLPPGTATWSTQVTLTNKSLTILGCGIGNTVITSSVGGAIFSAGSCGNKRVDISGISWIGSTVASTPVLRMGNAVRDSNTNYRLHHMAFTLATGGRGILLFGKSEGVVDHCTFRRSADGTAQGVTVWGDAQYVLSPGNTTASFPAGTAWTGAAAFGDSHRAYIEDCDFDFEGPNDAAIEGYFGAKYCVRHCTFKNTLIGNHGLDSGVSATHSYEIYQNTWTNTTYIGVTFEARGGTGLVWGNKLVDQTPSHVLGSFFIKLENYRAVGYAIAGHGASGGFITGSNPYDGNQLGVSSASGFNPCGWPALESVGTTGPVVLHADHADVSTSPFYEWNNTYGVDLCHQTGGSQIGLGPGYTPIRATGTNLVIDNSDNTKVTSATRNFVATGNNATSDVGSWLHVVSGIDFAPGWYQILSCAGNAAILDRTPGIAGSSGGTWTEEWSAIVPADIIKENRDYYRSPKPGYTPYPYPHL